jgi:hypothetical protein
VLLVVDTTFAPGSQILAQLERLAPELAAMVFVSMSKSVSRGTTTAGAASGGAVIYTLLTILCMVSHC